MKKEGARRIFVLASHGIFTGNSMELIDLSPVERVIVTDSIDLPTNRSKKIDQISMVPIIAKIIESEAISTLASWNSDKRFF